MSVKHTELPSDDLIAFALTEAFGEKCPDFDPDCYTCQAWAKYDAVKDLVDALERAQHLVRLVTVRQVINAGDDAIEAAGLNPWAINEGLAEGSEPIRTYWIDAALAKFNALSAEKDQ